MPQSKPHLSKKYSVNYIDTENGHEVENNIGEMYLLEPIVGSYVLRKINDVYEAYEIVYSDTFGLRIIAVKTKIDNSADRSSVERLDQSDNESAG